MSSKKQSQIIDPVILVTLGIVLVTIAIMLAIFQPGLNIGSVSNSSGTLSQLIVAFVTGLTTGGLSCLAVQGGLLATSLARQLELDMQSLGPRQRLQPQV